MLSVPHLHYIYYWMSVGRAIPDYPGQKVVDPPKPPKYLVKVSDERTEIIKVNHGAKGSASSELTRPTKFVHPDPLSRAFQNTKVSILDSQEKILGPLHFVEQNQILDIIIMPLFLSKYEEEFNSSKIN